MSKLNHLSSFIILLLFIIIAIIIYQIVLPTSTPKLTFKQKEIHAVEVNHKTKHEANQEPEDYDSVGNILKIAQSIKGRGKILLIAIISDASVPFAQNWLCNTAYMGIHDQVLIVVTNMESHLKLAKQWPTVHIASLPRGEVFSEKQEYSHAGYIRMTSWRTRILTELTKREVELILFEVDCIWLSNPISEIQNQAQSYDIGGIRVALKPELIGYGFLYLKPSPGTLKVLQKLADMLIDLLVRIKKVGHAKAISVADNSRTYLSSLVFNSHSGVRVNLMPQEKFPDVRWYDMDKIKRDRLHPKPLIIVNNEASENKVKIARAKKWKHWFWQSESSTCDHSLVTKTVQ